MATDSKVLWWQRHPFISGMVGMIFFMFGLGPVIWLWFKWIGYWMDGL